MNAEFERTIETVEAENRELRNKVVILSGKLYLFHRLLPELENDKHGHVIWTCSCGFYSYLTTSPTTLESVYREINYAHKHHVIEVIG